MPALNFKKCFAPRIKSGMKRQTIRAHRKNPIERGDMLYLYTGLRTKNCEKLGTAVCRDVFRIVLCPDDRQVFLSCDGAMKALTEEEIEVLAVDDGFTCPIMFFNFFQIQLVESGKPGNFFDGDLIKW
jgi:hypothetical protein